MATTKRKNKASKEPPRRVVALRLDTAFYPSRAVKRAQKAFSHLAEIDMSREGRHLLVRFGGIGGQVAGRLLDEFANYALSCAVVEE